MKTIVIVSSKVEIYRKIKSLLGSMGIYSFVTATSFAELSEIVSSQKEGIILYASMKGTALIEIDRLLPIGWDIVAILPSGVPQPFYSSSLTVLNSPVSRMDFSDTMTSLMAFSSFKRTSYGDDKNEIIAAAKRKIMVDKNTDENSAHRFLQKKSMEKGRTVFETALDILGK